MVPSLDLVVVRLGQTTAERHAQRDLSRVIGSVAVHPGLLGRGQPRKSRARRPHISVTMRERLDVDALVVAVAHRAHLLEAVRRLNSPKP